MSLADDLGGQDKLTEPAKVLVRTAAALTVQVENIYTAIMAGQEVNVEQLTRLSNTLGRTLQRLGIKRRPPKSSNPLAEHFSRPPNGEARP